MRALGHSLFLLLVAAWQASAIDPVAVELERVTDHVWLHRSVVVYNGATITANGLVVEHEDALILVDTAWGPALTATLLERIQAEIGAPVTAAFVTHFHDDSAGGVPALMDQSIPVYAHPLTQKRLKDLRVRPIADLEKVYYPVAFHGLTLFYPGPTHSQDLVMVDVAKDGLLFGSCGIRALDFSGRGNVSDADLINWPHTIRAFMEGHSPHLPTIVVPGHGAVGGPELLDHTITLFDDGQTP